MLNYLGFVLPCLGVATIFLYGIYVMTSTVTRKIKNRYSKPEVIDC